MSEKKSLHAIQSIIGYTFNDPSILNTALTHTSAAKKDTPSNEGLVFLGKAVCDLLIKDYIYSNFLSDSKTSELDVNAADKKISGLLKSFCEELKLAEYLTLSGTAAALRLSKVIEEETFAAVAGAIYKDGGMPSVRAFILPRLRKVMADKAPEFIKSPRRERVKNDRHPFSDDYSDTEKSSAAKVAANAIKNLFGSKKKKNETEEKASIQEQREATTYHSYAEERKPKERKISKPLSPSRAAQEANGALYKVNDGNYKSALQEFIQKNIRSSTVMLEYRDVKSSNGATTDIYLLGKKIASATGSTKKEASQTAARSAYTSITSQSGDAYKWFAQLKNEPERIVTEASSEIADYVSELNRTFQRLYHRSDTALEYEKRIAKNKKNFAVAVIMNGKVLGEAEGTTAKEAKQNAAKTALEHLKDENIEITDQITEKRNEKYKHR